MRKRFALLGHQAKALFFERELGELAAEGVALDKRPVDFAHGFVVELEPSAAVAEQHSVVPCDAVVAVVDENAVQAEGVSACDAELGVAEVVHVQRLRELESVFDFAVDFGGEVELAAPEVEHQHLGQLQKAHAPVRVLLAPFLGRVAVVAGELLLREKVPERVFNAEEALLGAFERQLDVDEIFGAARGKVHGAAAHHLLGFPVEQRLDEIPPRVFGGDRRRGEGVGEVGPVGELFFEVVHQKAAELLDVLLHVGRLPRPAEGLHQLRETRGAPRVLQVQKEPGHATSAARRGFFRPSPP